jgi:hypothetical protein
MSEDWNRRKVVCRRAEVRTRTADRRSRFRLPLDRLTHLLRKAKIVARRVVVVSAQVGALVDFLTQLDAHRLFRKPRMVRADHQLLDLPFEARDRRKSIEHPNLKEKTTELFTLHGFTSPASLPGPSHCPRRIHNFPSPQPRARMPQSGQRQ